MDKIYTNFIELKDMIHKLINKFDNYSDGQYNIIFELFTLINNHIELIKKTSYIFFETIQKKRIEFINTIKTTIFNNISSNTIIIPKSILCLHVLINYNI